MTRRRLSQRQIERIARIQERRRSKLAERAEQALDEGNEAPPSEGLVVARHGANLAVGDGAGHLSHCLTRQNIGHPVCGDRVVWHPTGPGRGVVTALLPRHNVLSRPDYAGRDRPLAANLTRLVVVLAPAPEPSEYLLDQYLVAAEQIGVGALITVSKMDLLTPEQTNALLGRLAVYRRLGYPLIATSARREHGLDALVTTLRGETAILVGQSGVGKSSLIKALLPDLDIQVGRLSEATGLGRHTTSAISWYRLPQGGALIDAPGVRSFRLGRLERAELERGYRDFHPFLGRCRFGDCRHDQEPGCAIRAAVTQGAIDPRRLANFRHLAARLDATEPLD